MKIAAAYIRVSTDDQIEYSPDSQLKAIQNYAERNGYYLPEQYVFSDEGISGRSTNKREGFNHMIALAKSKPTPFNTILVWKYSRFARNREDSVVYKSMLRKQCNIDVVSISEDVGDDKMSILFEAMIEAMDEYYSINLSEEVKRGMTEKAKRGGILSIPPFGYEVKDGEFIVIDSEAEIVKNVFESYSSGAGFLTLAKKLNEWGVKTHRGNRIEARTIEYWLNNPVYVGKIRWNPKGKTSRNYHDNNLIITDGTHRPIITDKLWVNVQQRLRENKNKYTSYRRSSTNGLSHWLVGVLRCGKCGKTLSNCGGFYYCSYKGKALCSGNGCISAKKISEIIINQLDEILNGDHINIQFDKSCDKIKSSNEQATLHLIQVKLEEINKKLERIKQAYENGVDTIEEYSENKNKILKEKEKLKSLLSEEQAIQEPKTSPPPDDEMKSLKENIKNVTDILKSDAVKNETKNSVVKSIIKEIVKTGEDGKTFQIVFWNPSKNRT